MDNTSPKNDLKMDHLMIRMAVIEIDSVYLSDYVAILEEEAKASVNLEDGVISIFPMYVESAPTRIKIVEIYADTMAYQSHLMAPHFLKYKKATEHMVKSLELLDMEAIDKKNMTQIFSKLN